MERLVGEWRGWWKYGEAGGDVEKLVGKYGAGGGVGRLVEVWVG